MNEHGITIISLPGKPQTKLRPRFSRHKGKVRTYDSQKEDKTTVSWQLKARMKDKKPYEGPVQLDLVFYMPIPKSTPKDRRLGMLEGEIKHTVKPDCDNLVKLPLDCMNGIVYIDDKQVYKLSAEKRYSENPRTEIEITCQDSSQE